MARTHTIFPPEFPEPWASDWGEDDYGIFMGFTYKGVRQDFRWVEPGTFLMGSPDNEPERFENQANFKASETVDVATYPPNDWGLYDIHGNVWEWCQDHHQDIWAGLLDGRGCRGGSWKSDTMEMRCAVINEAEHDGRSNEISFRLARS